MNDIPDVGQSLTAAAEEIDSDRWQFIPCAFCGGTGTDPFNQLSQWSRCEACHGRKQVAVPRDHVSCPLCHGTGSDKTYRCPACRGVGVLAAMPGPTRVCPACDGRGYEPSSGLECLTCRGRRVVAG